MVDITALGFDTVDLANAIAAGDVRSQVHPDFPHYKIYNYAEDVQFRNRWNNITLACRGLILDHETHSIVARPWQKFFNFGQRDLEIEFHAPVEVTDKIDGSLGILYRDPHGNFAIATRGSFASEQANHATTILHDKYGDFIVDVVGEYWLGQMTFLFEIVYPDNRIVCNYGDLDDLILLGAVHKELGYYVGPSQAGAYLAWPGPMAQVFSYPTFADAISAPDRPGAEGYVIRSGNKIVKLKQSDYVELHRIVTNLSPKTVWEMLRDGRQVDQICAEIPDEFHNYVKDIASELRRQASDVYISVNIEFGDILVALGTNEPSRKDFARLASQSDYKNYLFLMLDGKDVLPVIWQNIKPRGDIKTLVKDEG